MRANRGGKRKNALGGPRKSLIRLDSDKEIQAFPLVGLGWILLNLAQFGFCLDFPWMSYIILHIGATDLILSSPPAAPTRITAGVEPALLNLDSTWIRAPLAFRPDNPRLTLSDAYFAARNSGFSGVGQKPKFRPICGADPAPMPFPPRVRRAVPA
jgi:hypothetical protein